MPEDGYPTEKELKILKKLAGKHMWEVGTALNFLDFLQGIWWEPGWGFKLTGKKVLRLELHTAGWSGNEDIINTIHGTVFWMMYWQMSRRGGHYYFRIWEPNKGRGKDANKTGK